LPGLEPRHHEIEARELIDDGPDTGLPTPLRGSEVEPDVPVHLLLLEPLNESTLLPRDFDANLLRAVFGYQPEEVIDRLVHGLAGDDTIHPKPVRVGIIGPNGDH